jgi:hypothetical protein
MPTESANSMEEDNEVEEEEKWVAFCNILILKYKSRFQKTHKYKVL